MTAMKHTPLPTRRGCKVHPSTPIRTPFPAPLSAAPACLAWQHSEQFVCASMCMRVEVCRKAKFTFALSSRAAGAQQGRGFRGVGWRQLGGYEQHAMASRQRHPKCTHRHPSASATTHIPSHEHWFRGPGNMSNNLTRVHKIWKKNSEKKGFNQKTLDIPDRHLKDSVQNKFEKNMWYTLKKESKLTIAISSVKNFKLLNNIDTILSNV